MLFLCDTLRYTAQKVGKPAQNYNPVLLLAVVHSNKFARSKLLNRPHVPADVILVACFEDRATKCR